jgi:hypothetical protein
MDIGGVRVPSLEPLMAWEDQLPENDGQSRGQNRTWEGAADKTGIQLVRVQP